MADSRGQVIFAFCNTSRQLADQECKMENINANGQASFRWMPSCTIMGLVVSVSSCFAQENQGAAQGMKRVEAEMKRLEQTRRQQEMRMTEERAQADLRKKAQGLPFGIPARRKPTPGGACDSLFPEDCFRALQRRMQLTPDN